MSTPDLSPEEMRIASAEACGWKLEWQGKLAVGDPERELLHMLRPDGGIEIAGYFKRTEFDALRRGMANYVPRYDSDLNAMHEAEKTLSEPQINAYERELGHATRGNASKPGPGYKLWHATALQRCRAFLATIAATLPASVQANEKGNE
jgi:hypothetical protein